MLISCLQLHVARGFFSVSVSVPAQLAMYRNKMLTIPVGTAGCSGPLGIYMGWITQDKAGEIMESMVVFDWSWEGHGLRKGDVITAIQGVPVKNMKKSFLFAKAPAPSI